MDGYIRLTNSTLLLSFNEYGSRRMLFYVKHLLLAYADSVIIFHQLPLFIFNV